MLTYNCHFLCLCFRSYFSFLHPTWLSIRSHGIIVNTRSSNETSNHCAGGVWQFSEIYLWRDFCRWQICARCYFPSSMFVRTGFNHHRICPYTFQKKDLKKFFFFHKWKKKCLYHCTTKKLTEYLIIKKEIHPLARRALNPSPDERLYYRFYSLHPRLHPLHRANLLSQPAHSLVRTFAHSPAAGLPRIIYLQTLHPLWVVWQHWRLPPSPFFLRQQPRTVSEITCKGDCADCWRRGQ